MSIFSSLSNQGGNPGKRRLFKVTGISFHAISIWLLTASIGLLKSRNLANYWLSASPNSFNGLKWAAGIGRVEEPTALGPGRMPIGNELLSGWLK
jgi:hypothetical protein